MQRIEFLLQISHALDRFTARVFSWFVTRLLVSIRSDFRHRTFDLGRKRL